MSDNETQTFETANGHATQTDDPEELTLPPVLADGIDKLGDVGKRLRKTWKPSTKEGQELKRWMTNYFMETLEELFVVFASAFTETYQFTAMVNANQMQFREQMLASLQKMGMPTGAPILDGTVSEEQIAAVRRALAQHGLVLAEKHADDEELNDGFNRLLIVFTSLLGQDLLPLFDEDDSDDASADDYDPGLDEDADNDYGDDDSEPEVDPSDGEPELASSDGAPE